MLRRGRHAPEMLALIFSCAYLLCDEQRGNLLLMLSASVELEMLFHPIIFFLFKKNNYLFIFSFFSAWSLAKNPGESTGKETAKNSVRYIAAFCERCYTYSVIIWIAWFNENIHFTIKSQKADVLNSCEGHLKG